MSKYGHHHRCREQFRVLIAYTHTQCGLECVGLGVCFGTDRDGMLSLVGEGLAGRNRVLQGDLREGGLGWWLGGRSEWEIRM